MNPLAEPSRQREWAEDVHRALTANRVRQVACVPDAGIARLIVLCGEDPAMVSVSLTSEEEGVAMLAGAALGGDRGVLLMQSSGIGNCINMLSLARTCEFPILMIAAMRGGDGEFNPWQVPMGQAAADALKLMGVRVFSVDDPAAAGATVDAAARTAFETETPAAVLLSQDMIGAKTFEH